ncbi:hypothetical protein H2199_005302 [Coniosporium tulheliwenetii]|uniref:Uncharacterized protein n=1 Tax=Coniosporium tulheliwenetii TaxID=3383036 RepID=A0ACC2Z129_9PEZI|nr:hypothetical protein H2199_005302 [Cladosporium sp. JES 115]
MASSQTLFKVAAILNSLSIVGHSWFGFESGHATISTIPDTPQHKAGKRAAHICFNYVNNSLAVAGALYPFPVFIVRLKSPFLASAEMPLMLTDASRKALLNWQWARTGGPRTREEWAMFWIILGAGFWHGFRYSQGGQYAPLGALVVAPILGALATSEVDGTLIGSLEHVMQND